MATAAGTTASAKQQQQAALFKAKHEELLSEARGVAFEFGVNVRAIACGRGPGGAAVVHDFVGTERVADSIARAVARDVSAMGMEQVVEHQRKLRQMRALVARELQVRAEAKAAAAAAAPPAAHVGASKRALGQQEMMMAAGSGFTGGSNKIRRTG